MSDGDHPQPRLPSQQSASTRPALRLVGHGHEPEELTCFLYEFGRPTMVADGENVEPWIFPIHMSSVDRYRVTRELQAAGVAVTEEAIVARALEIKEGWIDNTITSWSSAPGIGCMFAEAPYLFASQRDAFSFAQGIGAYGDKCAIWSFQ